MRTRSPRPCVLLALAALALCLWGAPAPAQQGGQPVPQSPAKPEAPAPPAAAPRKTAAADVIRAAARFASEAKCRTCGGDGKTKVETVTYPRHGRGGALQEPTKRTSEETCKHCGGSGLSPDASFAAAADELIRGVAGLSEDDPRAGEARDRAAASLQAALKGRRDAAAEHFNKEALRRTNDQPLKIGVPVMVIGYLHDDPSGVGESRPLQVGVTKASPAIIYMVSKPAIVKAAAGERVVVGGIFAGRQPWTPQHTAPVLEHGFVIVLPD